MSDQVLKVRIDAPAEEIPFSEEGVFKAIAENLDRIQTDNNEACLLVTGPMAMILYWEDDVVVVEKVMKSSELEKK